MVGAFLVVVLAGLGNVRQTLLWSLALGIGFAGVVIVIRPGTELFQWASLLVVVSSTAYALYQILTRRIAGTDSPETSAIYSSTVGGFGLILILPFVWQTPQSWWQALLLVAIGAMASIGHFMLISAHKLTPASVLSPFMYTQLVWATTLGFLVFGDVPTEWTLLGAAIVVASGLYLIYRERKVTGRVAPLDPG